MWATILKCCLCCLVAVTLTFVMPVEPQNLNHASQTTPVDGPCAQPAPRSLSYAERFGSQDTNWKKSALEIIRRHQSEEGVRF
jgi:hypothetical protein